VPKRRIVELEYVDEFLAGIEVQKVDFAERTLAAIREMEKSPYEVRQERLAKQKQEKEAKASEGNSQ
jgi:hypothetical protein